MGDRAVLVEDPPGGPAAWGRGVRAAAIGGVVDVVPAARTVLVHWSDAVLAAAIVARLVTIGPVAVTDEVQRVTIPVRYDGPDLGHVARATGLTVDDVVALHSGADYEVAFCGFAPGFGYVGGLPERLHLPRRSTPRPAVPAGSVAIAAQYTAVYPARSPGGWHLIGTTDVVMFDVDRDPPALLAPGTRVGFEPA